MSNQLFFHRITQQVALFLIFNLAACAPHPPMPSSGHLNTMEMPLPKENIPPTIQNMPFVPPPTPSLPLETYTVLVNAVPVDELLFALARDANLNIDIYPGIQGRITLNAINQTIPQILERIANQVDLRYEMEVDHLTVSPDIPYLKEYKIDYVNMSRDSTSQVKISTQSITDINSVGSNQSSDKGSSSDSGGSDNDSTSLITNITNNHFWETLEKNINAILVGEVEVTATQQQNVSRNEKGDVTQETNTKTTTDTVQNKVMVNAESGIIAIRATARQHKEIQRFLDQVLSSATRQVLIEATIAEVTLNDQYQAGIDWKRVGDNFGYQQAVTGGNLASAPFYSINYNNNVSKWGDISLAVRLLERFGKVKVLSSPKIMALNNQTAILKVVDNKIYFTVDTQSTDIQTNNTNSTINVYSQTVMVPNVLPVGLIMSITPQISSDDMVILNVRPTISRITGLINDPTPALAEAGIISQIPETQVREIESILKISNGNIAIIGGLMQDDIKQNKDGIPVLSDLPLIGDVFSYRNDLYNKIELIIFIRPIIIKEASLSGDLEDYRDYLPIPQADPLMPTGFIQREQQDR